MGTAVAILGAAGRMGRMLLSSVLAAPDLSLRVAIEYDDHPELGRDAATLVGRPPCGIPLTSLPTTCWDDVAVVVDFSLPDGTRRLLELERDLPLVTGTTGLPPATRAAIGALAVRVPVVAAPNFSTGITLLTRLVAEAARLLPDYDAEIVETHHRRKRDAPSGTALRLAESVAAARSTTLEQVARFGRHGETGARPTGEIGVHALRGGDIVGRHQVMLAGDGEIITLSHSATSRMAFVQGALRAARWVVGQPAGLYGMEDVLGF